MLNPVPVTGLQNGILYNAGRIGSDAQVDGKYKGEDKGIDVTQRSKIVVKHQYFCANVDVSPKTCNIFSLQP